MELVWQLIFTLAFTLLFFLGGGAIGLAWRGVKPGSRNPNFLWLWGSGMVFGGLVLEIVFLASQGNLVLGLVGLGMLVVTIAASKFSQVQVDIPALVSAVVGTFWVLVTVLVLVIGSSNLKHLKTEDYVGGGVFVLLGLGIGGALALNGFRAIFRGISLERYFAEQELKLNEQRNRKPK